ncbi:S8 family serine peptidase [Haloferax larsenii]|uniref:S8 family serine peptidase n=1 Tax=Haloferax larsenii TaxID=302484 RepID=A0ABY5RIQ8_HALLR|nr:S8 family serine peptidase [Haloferax larsenii]ELZ76477.1 subtilisin [Haloferax larsenii JCM 13917]UVE51323.1 S8 family serine peptidase [Haloferax larsenii]
MNPPEPLHNSNIKYQRDFLGCNDDFTDIHGVAIFELLSKIAPEATFSFYQAMDAERRLPTAAFTRAIHQAVDDGVDILNLSWGSPNGMPPECTPQYPPVKHAVDNQVIVVAAAGNQKSKQGRTEYVFSPALAEETVAVSGFEALCPMTMKSVDNGTEKGPYRFESDNQNRVFCSHQGCDDSPACVRSKTLREWPNNTEPLDGKPDILGPAHMPDLPDSDSISDVNILEGTSYAAPVVAGVMSGILSESDISPDEVADDIHFIIKSGGQAVSGTDIPAINSFAAKQRLLSEINAE